MLYNQRMMILRNYSYMNSCLVYAISGKHNNPNPSDKPNPVSQSLISEWIGSNRYNDGCYELNLTAAVDKEDLADLVTAATSDAQAIEQCYWGCPIEEGGLLYVYF